MWLDYWGGLRAKVMMFPGLCARVVMSASRTVAISHQRRSNLPSGGAMELYEAVLHAGRHEPFLLAPLLAQVQAGREALGHFPAGLVFEIAKD